VSEQAEGESSGTDGAQVGTSTDDRVARLEGEIERLWLIIHSAGNVFQTFVEPDQDASGVRG
jgi:hypothetical protein